MMRPLRLLALALTAAAAACLAGAFWLPLLRAHFVLDLPPWIPAALGTALRDWLVEKGRIPVGEHYLAGIIARLFQTHEYFVATALALFSIIFPMAKIGLSAALGVAAEWLSPARRDALLHGLALTAKWSMADVFVVALVVVFFKGEGLHFSFTPEAGLYCYAAAALASSAAVALVGGDLRGAHRA